MANFIPSIGLALLVFSAGVYPGVAFEADGQEIVQEQTGRQPELPQIAERGGSEQHKVFLRYIAEEEKIARQEDAERRHVIHQTSRKWMAERRRVSDRRDIEKDKVRSRATAAAEEVRRRHDDEADSSWVQRVAELNRVQRQADTEIAEIDRLADAEMKAIGHQEDLEQRDALRQISEKWAAERRKASLQRDREIEEIVRQEGARRSAANEEERGRSIEGGRTDVLETEESGRIIAGTITPQVPSRTSPGTLLSLGKAVDNTTVVLKWQLVDGATSYDLGVRDMLTGQLVVDRRVDHAPYPVRLQAGRRYRWNVAACNSRGCSNFTAPLYFSIPGSQRSSEAFGVGARIMSRVQAQNMVALWISANRRADGYIYHEATPDKFRHECVALVKVHSRTENTATGSWSAGLQIEPTGTLNLPSGTPIATFLSTGRYPQEEHGWKLENGSWPHAAIFIAYAGDPDTGNVTGMWVIDQYSVDEGKPAGVSLESLSEKVYSVIEF